MKLAKILTVFTILGYLMSCTGTTEHQHESHPKEEHATHQEEKAVLSLNNGVKWIADEATYNGMKQMKSAIINFRANKTNVDIKSYNILGNQLGGFTKEIIAKCSMQGADHDQLHIVLAPMLANVDTIKKGGDINQAEKNIDALQVHLEQFFNHFKSK